MKILTISFTNQTSRYLSFIEEEILNNNNNNTSFVRLSIYPSSHFYYKHINKKDQPLYKFKFTGKYNNIPDIPKLRNYHTSILRFFNKKKYHKKLLNEYLHLFSKIQNIMNTGITHCMLIGDSRMPIEIASYIAKLNKIKCLYIEQAPYGNMIFDFKGVNKNISFEFKNISNEVLPVFKNKKHKNYWNSFPSLIKYKWLIIDWYYLYGFSNKLFLIGSDNLFKDIFNTFFSKLKTTRLEDKFSSNKFVVFLPLQMPVDVQSIYHSTSNGDSEEVALHLINSIPKNCTLLIKEHPNWKNKYSKKLYKKINLHKNVSLINNTTINNCFKFSDIVLTVNSTVGLEALNQGKQVYLTGDAYYGNPKIVHGIGNKLTWENIINAYHNPKLEKDIASFLLELKKYFINGHYVAEKLESNDKMQLKLKEFLC